MLCVGFQTARACNVPAFRYALERWSPDLYRVVVYCESVPGLEEYESLRKQAAERNGPANYALKTVDVSTPGGRALARERKITAYPWVEVYYPARSDAGVVWSGPLTSGSVKRVLESRGRAKLVQSLLGGDVAVWVLVKSGDEAKDRRALDSLTASLKRAAATLRIPEIGTDQNGDPVAVDDFKTYPVHFALMQIAHDDPEEELLVNALLKSEPDLRVYDEPVAFPVFGRGRALYALVGNGIQEKNILEACQSLMNWCSCEIKAQNPGTDLLISADWSRPYGGKMVEDPEAPLVGLGGFVKADPKAEAGVKTGAAACPVAPAVEKASLVAAAPVEPRGLLRNLTYTAGGAGLLIVAISVVLRVRRKR